MEGASAAAVFEAYVARVLSPMLCPGQIVVMDNFTAYKDERVKKPIEEKGCELLYLPPYAPDFNPIEEAFAKIKGILRKAKARSREALIETIGQASSAVSARDAQNVFEHCGYRAVAQPF